MGPQSEYKHPLFLICTLALQGPSDSGSETVATNSQMQQELNSLSKNKPHAEQMLPYLLNALAYILKNY
jgi:hypothetical protein